MEVSAARRQVAGCVVAGCVVAVHGTLQAELGFISPPNVTNEVLVCGVLWKKPVRKSYSSRSILRLKSVSNCPTVRTKF